MKKQLFIIVLLLQSYMAGAQVTGYLGKHFILSYSPQLYVDASNDNGGKLYLRNGIRADAILGRKFTLGLEYCLLKFKREVKSDYAPTYLSTISSNRTALVFTFYGVTSKDITAPIGDFLRLKFFTDVFKINDPSGLTRRDPTLPYAVVTGSRSTRGIEIAYGYSKVIKDVIVIECSTHLNLYPYLLGSDVVSMKGTTGYESTDNYIQFSANGASVIGVSLSIGGLLF